MPPVDRVRIRETGSAADGVTGTVLLRERETVRVELDRQPINWTSRIAWFHARECAPLRRES